MATPAKNQFFDINKFPKDWGVVVFPISMSRISNAQEPRAIMNTLDFFLNKVSISRVGVNIIYTEGLYMNFEKNIFETKNRFAQTAVCHMGGVKNIIQKEFKKYQIHDAFNFESWFHVYFAYADFFNVLKKVQDLYKKDKVFQTYIALDAKEQKRKLTKQQLAFYLEEHAFSYLLLNRQLQLHNDFVNGREQWVLLCYPGKPPRGQIYVYQKDILNINEDSNPYKGQYDTVEKKFIDYKNVDLTTF